MVKSHLRSVLSRYAAAVLSVLAALLITLEAKTLFSTTFYGLFLCAVMFSAWYGGLLPGLAATVLSVLAFDYYFIPPIRSLNLTSAELPPAWRPQPGRLHPQARLRCGNRLNFFVFRFLMLLCVFL